MRSTIRLAAFTIVSALVFASCSGSGTVPTQPSSTQQTQSQTSTDNSMPAPPYEQIEAPLASTSAFQTKAAAAPAGTVSTVPFWTGSFSFGGTNYPFAILGTSPFAAAATTVVPAVIQPLTFVFENGLTIDGNVPSQALATSPIFKTGAFPTESGQFLDVMQRAEFNRVGTSYHVRLGSTPTVLAPITIKVPGRFGKAGIFSLRTIGLVDFNFLFNVLQNIIASNNYSPSKLAMFVVGNVFEYIPPGKTPRHCCIGGFHFAQLQGANGILTYAYTAYNSPGIFVGGVEDITIASHEVAEWGNDPLIGNVVPPWGFPTNPSVCANNLLEVGDPIEVFNPSSYPVTSGGATYHPQDIAFFSWFAHQVPSIGIHHQYSYETPPKLTAPPPACQ